MRGPYFYPRLFGANALYLMLVCMLFAVFRRLGFFFSVSPRLRGENYCFSCCLFAEGLGFPVL